MKKIILLCFWTLITAVSFAQNNTNARQDSILEVINEKLSSIKYQQTDFGRHKLYPTDNMYVFLKLDSGTGVIKLLQWSLKKSEEFEIYVNSDDLSNGYLREAGRFELYPTKNIYQFILIDTVLGSTWHVQWGFESGDRWIRKISL
jgi:hypothetical protein